MLNHVLVYGWSCMHIIVTFPQLSGLYSTALHIYTIDISDSTAYMYMYACILLRSARL